MRETVVNYLAQKGIKVVSDTWYEERLPVWREWYKGEVEDFHKYTIYTGTQHIHKKRMSLKMGSQVAQDWADLLLNERVDITVSEDAQDTLNNLLKQVNFYVKGNNLIELAFALGGGFFVQYWDGEKTNQKYVPQDLAFPISVDNGKILEIAFASEKKLGEDELIYIEIHQRDKNKNYVINNAILTKQGKKYKEISKEKYTDLNIKDKWETGSQMPLFQQIKPNIVNRYNVNSPYGISVYDAALDAFRKCDLDFNAYYNEIEKGKKRIFVKDGAINVVNFDDEGNPVKAFVDDDVFYSTPEDENSPMITESNMALRVNELEVSLQNSLNLISQKCGFGSDNYKWQNGSVATATQIISENSKMFRTLQKHEGLLREAIINMAKGLLFIESHFNKGTYEDVEVSVDFDDSIIEDTAEKKRQATQDFNLGLISMQEYFADVYEMTDEQAEDFANKMIEQRNQEMQKMQIEREPELET